MSGIEEQVLHGLFFNPDFAKHVLPFLKEEYFTETSKKTVFKAVDEFVSKYNVLPSKDEIIVSLRTNNKLSEDSVTKAECVLAEVASSRIKEPSQAWLVEHAEAWIKERSVYNSVLKCIEIINDEEQSRDQLPDILKDALSISFNKSVGQSLTDVEERFEKLHAESVRIPFDIDMLNTITGGGLPKKTLTLLIAGCVHPDTKVKIRTRQKSMQQWHESISTVGRIQQLMNNSDVEIDSPDGWVPIAEYVDKGIWDEYILQIDGHLIRCNENHLFETASGWFSAKELFDLDANYIPHLNILTKSGYRTEYVIQKTGNRIPIVDVVIDHPNHRYWTENVSSHNTNAGKSMVKCSFASSYIKSGKNVLYITLEMAEERILERIDANLLQTNLGELEKWSKEKYVQRMSEVLPTITGKMVVKEYPTAGANVAHFRALLNDLQLKQEFVPDIIMVDYVNIMSSVRYKAGNNVNSYSMVKSIAEELRGLAIEFNVPIISSTQFSRSGNNNSDSEITEISDSFGTAMIADAIFAIIRTEALDEQNMIMFKQLKNRFSDPVLNKRFVVGVDRAKMLLYNVDQPANGRILEKGSPDEKEERGGPSGFSTLKKKKDFSSIEV
jgi:replicative DNA helicase